MFKKYNSFRTTYIFGQKKPITTNYHRRSFESHQNIVYHSHLPVQIYRIYCSYFHKNTHFQLQLQHIENLKPNVDDEKCIRRRNKKFAVLFRVMLLHIWSIWYTIHIYIVTLMYVYLCVYSWVLMAAMVTWLRLHDYGYMTTVTWLWVHDYGYMTMLTWLWLHDYAYMTRGTWLRLHDYGYMTTVTWLRLHDYSYMIMVTWL